MSVEKLGEIEVINRLARALGRGAGVHGIGDDGVLLRDDDGRVAVADTLVEGVHFRLEWSSARDVGYKALARNISDCRAMGAEPRAWLLSLGLRGWNSELLDELIAGFVEARDAHAPRLQLVGGDTTGSPRAMFVAITMLGDVPKQPFARSAAAPGQRVWVAGELGWASCGLEILERGRAVGDDEVALVEAHRRPRLATVDVSRMREAGVTAAIDVSDGLAIDLWRVVDASAVRIEVDARLPGIERVEAYCGSEASRVAVHQWTGGDDYALIAFGPRSPGAAFVEVGRVVEGAPGLYLHEADGVMQAVDRAGHLHGGETE